MDERPAISRMFGNQSHLVQGGGMFKKILIANRGEIALRVIRTARELGVKTVVVYSTADEKSLPVLLADESVCVGPPASNASYLNIPNILQAALMTGAEGIHPGYGFMAENPDFAEMCREHGLVFIGPTPESMRALGSKAGGREIAAESNVPVVPGTGILADLDAAVLAAKQIGYPVLLKASAGGGGRGQKVIRTQDELKKGFAQAQEEARLYFSDPDLIMEKFLEEFRHVEVQVMGDGTGHVIHIGERDCSIQRRNQKLIEEAPSTLPDSLRQEILAAGVRLAQHVNYAGAGTLEFIVDRDGNYYFMEMNTRIQVEHCVSEMISGLDLVRMQLEIASGHGLNMKQEDVVLRGHAIECRLNAEDPDKDFRPAAGRIDDVHFAGGPGVRVDSHVYTGYVIPPHYDSLIGKLIVHHDNRAEAIARMKRALEETVIQGPKTTIPLYIKIMDNPFYKRGAVMTNFLKTRMDM